MEGDRRVAAERMEAEGKMEPKEELQRARAAYFTALETGEELENKKFTYAWCLIYMKDHEEIRTGITLLQELAEIKSLQREALYYLAVAQYRLEMYMLARNTLKQLLAIDPNNKPALDLKALIEHVLRKEVSSRCEALVDN
uniref:Mitochondrial fission 1 protein n=1 Tax=Guillardia theta TaxID=55529 RepID=A0A7S4NCI1_GUITH